MGLPAPPRPLKAPRLGGCRNSETPQIPHFATACVSRLFTSSASCRHTGGEWDRGSTEQRNQGPRPSAPPQPPTSRGTRGDSRTSEPPHPRSHTTFERQATGGRAGGGCCPRATDRLPRNRPEWQWTPTASTYWAPVISSAVSEKPAKSSYASLQCVAFSCHFFIIKEGVKLARSLPLHPPLPKRAKSIRGGEKHTHTHTNLRGDAIEVWLVFKYPICQCKGSGYVYKVPFASDSSTKPAMRGLVRWMRRGSGTLTERKVRSALPHAPRG